MTLDENGEAFVFEETTTHREAKKKEALECQVGMMTKLD
jgi:hypothetical protein